jgi:hypothetical protein
VENCLNIKGWLQFRTGPLRVKKVLPNFAKDMLLATTVQDRESRAGEIKATRCVAKSCKAKAIIPKSPLRK